MSDTAVPMADPAKETPAPRRQPLARRLVRQPLVGSAMLIVPLVLLVIVVQLFFTSAAELTATNFLISVIAVLGLGLFWGNSGILSLGHVGLMALGAYFGATLVLDPTFKEIEFTGLPDFLMNNSIALFPATLLTIVFVALAALLMGLLLLRMGGAAFVIASFGLLVIVYSLLVAAKELTHGAQGVYGLSGDVGIWTALAWAAVTIVVARVYRDSIPGLQLRASREDELAARAAGVNVEARRLQAWVISAVPMAVAGILLGVFLSAFSPPAFYLGLTVTYIAMAIVGGLGTVAGAVAGTVLMTALVEILRRLEGGFDFGIGHFPAVLGLTQIGLSIAILLTLYLRPKGVVGEREPDEHLVAKRSRRRAVAPTRVGADQPQRVTPDAPRLAAHEVTKSFEGLQALKGVSLEVTPGSILGLIGPNGSGKTTLLNILTGVLEPTTGQVHLDGQQVDGWAPRRLARAGVGRTFQNIRLFGGLTVLDNVRVGLSRGRTFPGRIDDEAWSLLTEFGLADYAHRVARTLPYGLQRRLEIARALALRPSYLLLDEPAAGMNETEADSLRETLFSIREREGVGILIVDHVLRVVMQISDRVVVLNEGRLIAEGPPGAIQADPAVIEAYLGHRSQPGRV